MSALGVTIGITTAAVGAAAVAVPAFRRLAFGDVKRDWIANELEFDKIDSDKKTVLLKSGIVFQVIAIRGVSYETFSPDAQFQLLKGRMQVFRSLYDQSVNLRLVTIKKWHGSKFEAEWPSDTLAKIGKAEQAICGESFDIVHYLIIESDDRRHVNEAVERTIAALSRYKAKLVTAGVNICELTSLCRYLITGKWWNCEYRGYNLSAAIQLPNLQFSSDGVLESHDPQPIYQRVVTVRLWPEEISGRVIAALLALPFELEISHVALAVSSTKSTLMFDNKAKQFKIAGMLGNASGAAEYDAAREMVMGGEQSFHQTQFSLVIKSTNKDLLADQLSKVTSILGINRVNFSVETKATPIVWFNRLPGHNKNLLRPLYLLGQSMAALWPFPFSPRGLEASPIDNRPVRLFKSVIGQSYNFQFHLNNKPQALGHFAVFAPSGSGKSTLIMHLLSGLAKVDNFKSYIFDSLEGTRFMVEAMGGIYQSYDKIALNPLDYGPDIPVNRQLVRQVMMAMLGDNQATPEILEEIDRTIDFAFSVDVPDRTVGNVFKAGFNSQNEAFKFFSQWFADNKGNHGAYSHIFSAAYDSLSSLLDQSFMVGLNMNEALKDPILAPPIITHITNMISRVAAKNSKGFAIFIDEAAALLQNNGFKESVQVMFREYRKLNGIVGLAFQDPSALIKSGIQDAVLANLATMIFFPNLQAQAKDYEAFNLSDEEINFICGGVTGTGREVLVVRRDAATDYRESAVIDIDLSPYGDCLKFYRSGSDAVAAMIRLQEEWGAEWHAHL